MPDIAAVCERPLSLGLNGPPSVRSRSRRWLAIVLAALAIVLVGELSRIYLGSNLHAVAPGQIYRAAQPTADQLKESVRSWGVRTVVNLRGCGNPFDWYIDECRAAQDLGIAMEDLSFSANRTPSATEL